MEPSNRPDPPDAADASRDLEFMQQVVRRTHAHVDPHLFHFVHWGWIVLIWYPIGNWLRSVGRDRDQVILALVSLFIGFALSIGREIRLSRRPRMPAENTFVTRQLQRITAGCVGAGVVLSAVAPAFSVIRGEDVPVIWGVVYANLAFMTGVIYDRMLVWAGIGIFAGAVLAMMFPAYNGYILGPFMGLGMILPGLRGEARVRALLAEGHLEPGSV